MLEHHLWKIVSEYVHQGEATYYEADNGDNGVDAIEAPHLPHDRNVVEVPVVRIVHKCGDVRGAKGEEEQFEEHLEASKKLGRVCMRESC